jgi:hypothetical protein
MMIVFYVKKRILKLNEPGVRGGQNNTQPTRVLRNPQGAALPTGCFAKESNMKNEIGLWIDHKKTVIVFDKGNDIITLFSNLEKDPSLAGGGRGKVIPGSRDFPAEDQHDRRITEHLNKYYSEVIGHLCEYSEILILGPGEAKIEIKKRLEHDGIKHNITGVETADKLTDRQIAAKVKNFFENHKQPVH